jgi:glutamate racemase
VTGVQTCALPISFIGTVPAVKPAALNSKTDIIGALGSERTVEDPYIVNLAKKYRTDVKIKGIAAPELVEFVEHEYASSSIDEREQIVSKYINEFRLAKADGVVLSCTHFLFLLDEFRKAAAPDITIYDSIEGVGKQFVSVMNEQSLRTSIPHNEKNILLITGNDEPELIWKQRAETYKMKLEVLHQSEKGMA